MFRTLLRANRAYGTKVDKSAEPSERVPEHAFLHQ
ncbi:hypothetical protein TSMEX_011331 [Taenia solium]|eukprot:TsM_000128500 transcript=TsM_000128500 gene=TsM_000128500